MSRFAVVLLALLSQAKFVGAEPREVTFSGPDRPVEVWDYAEFVARVAGADAANPFADATLTAEVTTPAGKTYPVAGFCDAADGTTYRLRVMPTEPGRHAVKLAFAQGGFTAAHRAEISAEPGRSRGLLRVDPDYPYHFAFAGSGEHYFWNGTTAYYLLGVTDDAEICRALDRLAKLRVNRIRVALNGRTPGGQRWYEPQIQSNPKFRLRVDPWVAGNPEDIANPRFDTSRFNLPMWQKLDRLVLAALARGLQVSVIFFLDGQDPGVDPFGGGDKKHAGTEDEWRYYRYAAARLAAFENVMWDVTNEWQHFRNVDWVNRAATVLREADPYRHLMSVHGTGHFPFSKEPWADYAMYQSWDESGGYRFMRKHRERHGKLGRPMPQVNEEYGYEDLYPVSFGGNRRPPARDADSRRKIAWEISMAGGYQTTGEKAGVPDQGGWITGLGDDSMAMLTLYGHMMDFFTAFEWWRCEPADGLADGGAMALADLDRSTVAVYLPKGGAATVNLPDGGYSARWFNPRTGAWHDVGRVSGAWLATAPGLDDWALLLRR